MLIRNADALLGAELEHARGVSIRVSGGTFAGIGQGLRPRPGERSADCTGLLAVPGFVNAHTHVGDSVGKDVRLGGSVDARVHPVFGAKARILGLTSPGTLAAFMANSCRSMLAGGTTTFVDFREGGLEGVRLLASALRGIPVRAVVLGRMGHYAGAGDIRADEPLPPGRKRELAALLGGCDGLGLSGANENTDAALSGLSRARGIRAIHSAETRRGEARSRRMTGRSETARALLLRPHFLVHMTRATAADLGRAASETRGVVVCPRANAALAEGVPDIAAMRRAGCTLGLGTDNVMVNAPDMFREMDFAWKASMGMRRAGMDPREILKMATVNGGRLLRKRIGRIERGYAADCMFVDKHALDLEPMHDPHASMVHRASPSAIRAVMVAGRVVHGSL